MITIYFPEGANPRLSSAGIDVTYYKTTEEIEIGGWYDGMCGIEGARMPLVKFLTALGITRKDLARLRRMP